MALITRKETARRLGYSERSIDRLAAKGSGFPKKIQLLGGNGGGCRFDEDEVDAWVDGRRV